MALVVLPTLTSYIAETFPLLHLTLVALEAVAFPALTSVTPFLACQICMEELYIHGGWEGCMRCIRMCCCIITSRCKNSHLKIIQRVSPYHTALFSLQKKIFCPLLFEIPGFPNIYISARAHSGRSGSLIFAANEFRRFIGSRLDF